MLAGVCAQSDQHSEPREEKVLSSTKQCSLISPAAVVEKNTT